jgi:predicted nucleic acid-binding Zn ribbon protein
VSPDPDRVRLATEALARARADAWARGERPQAVAASRRFSSENSERTHPTADSPPSAEWSARPRRDDPQPLDTAVTGLLSARGWHPRAAVATIFAKWPEMVGPQLAAHTSPESFNEGELTLVADSDAWATQVRLLAPQLLQRLAAEGAGAVTRIRVTGPGRRSAGRRTSQAPRAPLAGNTYRARHPRSP